MIIFIFFLLLAGTAAAEDVTFPPRSITSGTISISSWAPKTPQSLIINVGKTTVTIKADGTIVYGEGVEPDDAAKVFWQAVGRNMPVCKKQ